MIVLRVLYVSLAILAVVSIGIVRDKLNCSGGCKIGATMALIICLIGLAFPKIVTIVLLCVLALNLINRLIKTKEKTGGRK